MGRVAAQPGHGRHGLGHGRWRAALGRSEAGKRQGGADPRLAHPGGAGALTSAAQRPALRMAAVAGGAVPDGSAPESGG